MAHSSMPSMTTIVLGVFLAYVSYSTWNMIQLFIPPECPNPKYCLHPVIAENPKLQVAAYVSIKKRPQLTTDFTYIFNEKQFDYYFEQEYKINISLPKSVRSNGTLFLHLFLTDPYVNAKDIDKISRHPASTSVSTPITQYEVPKPESFNLLGESEESYKEYQRKTQPVTHLQSLVVFNILTDHVVLPRDAVPYELGRIMNLNQQGKYLPILHIDMFSLRLRDLVEVIPQMEEMSLTLKYTPISYGKIRMWSQFGAAFESMRSLGFTNKDIDEVKGIFSDSNLYLLFVTFIVSVLHTIFDFLAFKNDISFWRGLDNMGGISSSTVAWRCFAQAVVFLYLMEEKTSLLVLIPAGIGTFIELWKVTKAFHIRLRGWRIEWSSSLTKEESTTKDLDSQGFKYLSYLLYPICIFGAAYSLLYIPHKSWYSWVVNSLVNGVYAFGFLFMLPQLFINYKLKSVAHLPWRAFMYKAFNTFIDDLFAFIITMPTAHRVACFRDDVVFVIYLYQRWLYPVDKSRVNEFGQTGEDEKKKAA